MWKRVFALSAFFILSLLEVQAAQEPPGASATCIGIVENKSQEVWYVQQVYYHGDKRHENGPTLILIPGEKAELKYAYGYSDQVIKLTSESGIYKKVFEATQPENTDFSTPITRGIIAKGLAKTFRSCSYIKHDGSTGAAVLNEPNNGDIILHATSAKKVNKPPKKTVRITRRQLEARQGCSPGWSSWSTKSDAFARCMGLFRPWMYSSGFGFWSGQEPPGFSLDTLVLAPAT